MWTFNELFVTFNSFNSSNSLLSKEPRSRGEFVSRHLSSSAYASITISCQTPTDSLRLAAKTTKTKKTQQLHDCCMQLLLWYKWSGRELIKVGEEDWGRDLVRIFCLSTRWHFTFISTSRIGDVAIERSCKQGVCSCSNNLYFGLNISFLFHL